MSNSRTRAFLRRLWKDIRRHPDRFLKDVSGVVHVGANTGQERKLYHSYGLPVVWVEPIPEVFAQLNANIEPYPEQRAFQALVTDVEGREYEFHIASNNGESSSILDMKEHRDIWPGVDFTRSEMLTSVTLPGLLERERIDATEYDALIMDTQGSELMVLQGAEPILSGFRYIKTEVPDFEAYEGCCQLADLAAFMHDQGYEEIAREGFARHDAGGRYYDVTYRRRSP